MCPLPDCEIVHSSDREQKKKIVIFDKDEGDSYPTRSSLHRYIVSTA